MSLLSSPLLDLSSFCLDQELGFHILFFHLCAHRSRGFERSTRFKKRLMGFLVLRSFFNLWLIDEKLNLANKKRQRRRVTCKRRGEVVVRFEWLALCWLCFQKCKKRNRNIVSYKRGNKVLFISLNNNSVLVDNKRERMGSYGIWQV